MKYSTQNQNYYAINKSIETADDTKGFIRQTREEVLEQEGNI